MKGGIIHLHGYSMTQFCNYWFPQLSLLQYIHTIAYAVGKGDLVCCWDCRACRNNEYVNENATGCIECPQNFWPDQEIFRSCLSIEPSYLSWTHPYGIGLVTLAGIGMLLSIGLIVIVIVNRQRRVIKGSNVQLMAVLLVGITVAVMIIWPADAELLMPVLTKEYVELRCSLPLEAMIIPLSFNLVVILMASLYGFRSRLLPENFNESWYIFLAVSTTLFIWIAFLSTYFSAFYAYHQASLLCLALILNGFTVTICMFGPKLYALLYIPDKDIKVSNFKARAFESRGEVNENYTSDQTAVRKRITGGAQEATNGSSDTNAISKCDDKKING